MFEKVNMYHPDKIADRIAGAIVDIAYSKAENPKIAVEVLTGHGICNIIIESSVDFTQSEIESVVHRMISDTVVVNLITVPQDVHLAENQSQEVRCGDNGIFKGVHLTEEEITLSRIARDIESEYPSDGKYIIDDKTKTLIICQSNITDEEAEEIATYFEKHNYNTIVNPLGSWTGGIDVDSGATNRKLGSDMAQSISGGGINGKDLSKADVSCNVYAFFKAQELGKTVEMFCAIGDTEVSCRIGKKETLVPYSEIVEYAKEVIKGMGGFEALSEYGFV